MKSFIDRFEFLLLLIPFACWFICFMNFFNQHLHLEADAIPYADQIGFYTDNLSKGVFPLWNPGMVNGVPYHFFLRRIGDVNPLFSLIVLLKCFGVSSMSAYLIFSGLYYFLAGWALYLITRFLLKERFFAFIAYILFLFSSWGSEVFYNYIIIVFVPIIWFFYFLLCFSSSPQKKSFLGMCFCVGLIFTTYVPFFFLTILAIFLFLYVLFYGRDFIDFFRRSFAFLLRNRVFTCFCVFFILMSCIPALIFYKESKSGDFVLPGRHSGADASSAVAVGLNNAASGDIISHGYFDRLFDDHANIDMGDIYVPYLFFLVLLVTIPARTSKLIFFLFFNILALSFITITSSAGAHRFIFERLIIFKFIRQLYYFFWLAMLPMAILLSVAAFKSLLTAIGSSSQKMLWLAYIIICHLIFMVFLSGHQGVLWGAWVAIFVSLAYFLLYFSCTSRISYPAGFILLLLAVYIQSAQVYAFMENKIAKSQSEDFKYKQTHHTHNAMKLDLYYTTRWFQVLIDQISPDVIGDFRSYQFIVYDNVVPYIESAPFFKKLESTMSSHANVAFVSKSESAPTDWRINEQSSPQADLDPLHSGKLSVLHADANTWNLKSHLSASQFLMIQDNYTRDWHATINGRPARLLRTDVSFNGLWLPSGDSDIVVRFSTPGRYLFHISMIILYAGTFLYFFVLMKKEEQWQA